MSGSEFPGASENIWKSNLGTPFGMMRQEICKAASSVTHWFAIGQRRKMRSVLNTLKDTVFWACQRS